MQPEAAVTDDIPELLRRSEELEDTIFSILQPVDFEPALGDWRMDAGVRLAIVQSNMAEA